MENEGLVELFEYNNWANRTLLDACRAAPDDLLDQQMPGISGTVRSLLTHLVGGQQTFALRTKGRQHEGEWGRRSEFPGFDELLRVADQTGAELLAAASGLQPGAKVTLPPYQGQVRAFPLRFFLAHAIGHGTEHRTEIKVALGAQGFDTPDLDGWAYAYARNYGEPA